MLVCLVRVVWCLESNLSLLHLWFQVLFLPAVQSAAAWWCPTCGYFTNPCLPFTDAPTMLIAIHINESTDSIISILWLAS